MHTGCRPFLRRHGLIAGGQGHIAFRQVYLRLGAAEGGFAGVEVGLQGCVPVDVGTGGRVVVHFHSDGVGALLEEVGGQGQLSGVGIAGGIGGGVGAVAHRALRHVVSSGLGAVHIDHQSVVDGEFQFEGGACCRLFGELGGVAEVVGGSLVVARGAVAQRGLDARLAVAQRGAALFPLAGGVVFGGPCGGVERALVVVQPTAAVAYHLLHVAALVFPSLEGVAGRRLGPDAHGGEEMALEAAGGHTQAVDVEMGVGNVAAEAHLLGGGAAQLHGRVGAQGVGHGVEPAAQVVLYLVGRLGGVYVLQPHHLPGAGEQRVYDGGVVAAFEHAAAHQTEGVDEPAAEVVVLEQVQEDGHEFYLGPDAAFQVVAVVEGVVLLVGECHERSVAVEGEVEVERDEPVAAVVVPGVAFHIVLGPVGAAQVELHGHVVGIFFYVEQLFYLLVAVGLCGGRGEFVQAVEAFGVAAFLYIR